MKLGKPASARFVTRDPPMFCQIFPPLEGVALERFHALSRQVMQQQQSRRAARLDELCANEVRWRVQEDRIGFERASHRYTS